MTLEELQAQQAQEQAQFMAAQIKAWQELQANHDRMRQSGNDHFPAYQKQMEQDLKQYHTEWGSEGKHATGLATRHEAERLKLTHGEIPIQKTAQQLIEEQKELVKRKPYYKKRR